MADGPGRRAPSLSGLDGWQQSGWRSLRQLRGKVVVVWFFSLSDRASMSMVPGLARLYRDHHHGSFEMIGVHSPDFAGDADALRLARTAARSGMIWPLAMDHRRTVFRRWQQDETPIVWPRSYVLDREGVIVGEHVGAEVDAVRATVEGLLGV